MKKKLAVFVLATIVTCALIVLPALAGQKLNINTASVEDLIKIKGIGQKKANAIVDYREAYGPFKTIEDVRNVKGIGNKLFESMKSQITTE
jgi:competence protein ComEA